MVEPVSASNIIFREAGPKKDGGLGRQSLPKRSEKKETNGVELHSNDMHQQQQESSVPSKNPIDIFRLTQTLDTLGIHPPRTTLNAQAVFGAPRNAKKLDASELKGRSPLTTDLYEARGTAEERNALSFQTVLTDITGAMSSPRLQKRAQRLYRKVVHALDGHDAGHIANGKIGVFQQSKLYGGMLANGSIVFEERAFLDADRLGQAIVKAMSMGAGQSEYADYVRRALRTHDDFALTASEQKTAQKIADGIITFTIGHEFAEKAQRTRWHGSPEPLRKIKGYSPKVSHGTTLSDRQKDEIFADVWGADLAVRAGVPVESILAFGLMAKDHDAELASTDGANIYPSGGDRYHFLHQWLSRMVHTPMRTYKQGSEPVVLGNYLEASALDVIRKFPLPGPRENIIVRALEKPTAQDNVE